MREESASKTPAHARMHAHQDKQREAGAEESQAGSPPREVWLLQPVKVFGSQVPLVCLLCPTWGPRYCPRPLNPGKT